MIKIFNYLRYCVFLFLLTASANTLNAQSTIYYGYDANGNRTSRVLKVQDLGKGTIDFPIDEKEIKEEEITPGDSEVVTHIYPNPTSGKLTVKIENCPEQSSGEYIVYTLKGNKLKQAELNIPEAEINMQDLPDGVYILLIKLNGISNNYKIIKHN
jgi:hypothetical protein